MSVGNYEALNTQQVESERDPFTRDRYRQFYRHFPKEASHVLDMGCNTGIGGGVLKACDQSLTIAGLDCVKDRLDRLPSGVYARGIYGLSTDIPAEDNMFDVVVAGEFIEHLCPMDVDRTLSEFFRVLKVGGRLLVTTPNPADIKRRLRGKSVLGGSHVSQHHASLLRVRLRMIGFSRVRLYGSGKVTWYLGEHVPLLNFYGSYLATADKK